MTRYILPCFALLCLTFFSCTPDSNDGDGNGGSNNTSVPVPDGFCDERAGRCYCHDDQAEGYFDVCYGNDCPEGMQCGSVALEPHGRCVTSCDLERPCASGACAPTDFVSYCLEEGRRSDCSVDADCEEGEGCYIIDRPYCYPVCRASADCKEIEPFTCLDQRVDWDFSAQ